MAGEQDAPEVIQADGVAASEARPPSRRRRWTIFAIAVVIVATPVVANLATPDAPRKLRRAELDRLPSVEGYVKEATEERLVIEREDGIFQTLETSDGLSAEDIVHLQEHARYGTATSVPFVVRKDGDFAVAVDDLEDFPGVDRGTARIVDSGDLDKIEEGDGVDEVLDLLGPPQEVGFDQTAPRDCWTWPSTRSPDHRAEVCFTRGSRAEVVRVSVRRPRR